MKTTAQMIAAVIGLLSAGQTLACCSDGCYSVKGEAFQQPDCPDDALTGASIANYGSGGQCIDISNAVSIKAHNDGCGSSHPDFHFFQGPGCPGGTAGGQVVRKDGGGECFQKPTFANSMIVVSN